MVSHADACVSMPANVNGCVVPLRGAWSFATVNYFRQRAAIAVTVVAHHVV